MCCVEYQVCTYYNGIQLVDEVGAAIANDGFHEATWNEAWTIDLNTAPMLLSTAPDFQSDSGIVDGGCSGDYVEIPSSYTGSCGASYGARSMLTTRYCGSKLGLNPGGGNEAADLLNHSPICDCSEPFRVTHHSDLGSDLGGQDSVNVANDDEFDVFPRGFCLDFRQTPCYH